MLQRSDDSADGNPPGIPQNGAANIAYQKVYAEVRAAANAIYRRNAKPEGGPTLVNVTPADIFKYEFGERGELLPKRDRRGSNPKELPAAQP